MSVFSVMRAWKPLPTSFSILSRLFSPILFSLLSFFFLFLISFSIYSLEFRLLIPIFHQNILPGISLFSFFPFRFQSARFSICLFPLEFFSFILSIFTFLFLPLFLALFLFFFLFFFVQNSFLAQNLFSHFFPSSQLPPVKGKDFFLKLPNFLIFLLFFFSHFPLFKKLPRPT